MTQTRAPALRPRLEAVASLVPHGCAVLDVGTDHAGLPVALVQRGQVSRAIAADVAAPPCALARRKVEAAKLTHAIEVRQSDGWASISSGEVDTTTLCGMGGNLIAALVARDRPHKLGVRTLVVQANKDVPALRQALVAAGWRPDCEAWVHDELAFVVVRFTWAPDTASPGREAVLLGGVDSAPPSIAAAWLTHELVWREARLAGLARSGRVDSELAEDVALLKGALRQLPQPG